MQEESLQIRISGDPLLKSFLITLFIFFIPFLFLAKYFNQLALICLSVTSIVFLGIVYRELVKEGEYLTLSQNGLHFQSNFLKHEEIHSFSILRDKKAAIDKIIPQNQFNEVYLEINTQQGDQYLINLSFSKSDSRKLLQELEKYASKFNIRINANS